MTEKQQEASAPQDIRNISRVIPKRRPLFMLLTFVIMAATWIVFSGQFDAFHLTLGVISCGLVAWFASDMLFPPDRPAAEKAGKGTVLRFILYYPWLLWEVAKANIWLLYIAFHPRMMEKIHPHVVEFDTKLKGQMARLTLANSITLTPGTITVSVDVNGRYTVHAIDEKSAAALPGDMEEKIGKTFGEL